MIQFQSRCVSDPYLADIDFKNKMVWGWTTLKRHLVVALGISDHKTVQAGKAEKCKNKSIWKSRKFDCVALGRQMLPSKECSSKLWYLIKFYQSLFISSVKFFVLWRLLKVTWYVSHVVINYTQLGDTKFPPTLRNTYFGLSKSPEKFWSSFGMKIIRIRRNKWSIWYW